MATVNLQRSDLHASVSSPILDTMNFLNEITLRYPEAISFAPGRPYDGFFDTERIFTHIRAYLEYLADRGNDHAQIRDALFQYGPTAGRIRDLIATALLLDEDISVSPESIIVTVGCQEAMFLALRVLMAGPRDVLMVSSPCYVGVTGAARLLDIELAAVNETEDGFRCADLDAAIAAQRALGRHPRAFYIVPDHSNPAGTTMPVPTRLELLALAARQDVMVLEDSPYRLVSAAQRLPTLKSLDRDRRVVYLGSFSKSAFPGARVGFAVADQPVTGADGQTSLLADEMAKIKSMVTVNTSPLSQAVIGGMLLACAGRLSTLNVQNAAYYGNAMSATLCRLDECFPACRREALGVHWNRPDGGFFLTMRVPFVADDKALARSAQEFGVIWTPMSYFYPQGGGSHSIRLSVSYLTHAEIVEGISRLARFVEAEAGLQVISTPVICPGEFKDLLEVDHRDYSDAMRPQQASEVGVDVPMTIGLAGVGTAVPENSYSQRELLDIYKITDAKVRSVFLNSAINRRFLSLPPCGDDGILVTERQGDLLVKHKTLAVGMAARAIGECLKDAEADPAAVGHLCCVTSTGFLTPGLSALLIRELGMAPECSRLDVVGMGCNAGLNALGVTASWAKAHPGQIAVMVCAEACSAAYVFDSTMRTAVVNSLFGDGAAAVAVVVGQPGDPAFVSGKARILSFASLIITDAIDAMRYDWDDAQGKFSFFLDLDIPYLVGAHAERVIDRLLAGAGLRRTDISHWLVHSGGKKVIDAIRVNLGLTRYDVRHTTGVLRDYGNLSSGSFLFSYDRLQREGVTGPGDYGVLMTMGPGSTIETALVQW